MHNMRLRSKTAKADQIDKEDEIQRPVTRVAPPHTPLAADKSSKGSLARSTINPHSTVQTATSSREAVQPAERSQARRASFTRNSPQAKEKDSKKRARSPFQPSRRRTSNPSLTKSPATHGSIDHIRNTPSSSTPQKVTTPLQGASKSPSLNSNRQAIPKPYAYHPITPQPIPRARYPFRGNAAVASGTQTPAKKKDKEQHLSPPPAHDKKGEPKSAQMVCATPDKSEPLRSEHDMSKKRKSPGTGLTSPKRPLKRKRSGERVATCDMPIPNRLITKDGNTTAFKWELLCGKKIAFTFWDLHNMSSAKLLSDGALTFAVDYTLREKGVRSDDGVVWVSEMLILEKIYSSRNADFDLSIPRWSKILNSKILLLPVFQRAHWSLLAVANCGELVERILSKSPTGKRTASKGPVQLPAVHLDSLSSSGHKDSVGNITIFLTKGILALWNHKHRMVQNRITPNVEAMVERSFTLFSAAVQQQQDGTSCGWRTMRHTNLVAHSSYLKKPSLIKGLVGPSIDLSYEKKALRSIAKARELSKPSTTDLPSLLFPLQRVVDREVFRYFGATSSNIAGKVKEYLQEARKKATDNKKRTNTVKIAQWDAMRIISERAVAQMKNKGLNKRRLMKVERRIPDTMCSEIAKFLFHYPQGEKYAECMFYTRYNYPDSLLVCKGLETLFASRPRVYGEKIDSQQARVTRSKSVHYQMTMIKDSSRGTTRYYHEVARFRLQVMESHFKGIAEAVVKSACKLALQSLAVDRCDSEVEEDLHGEQTKTEKSHRSDVKDPTPESDDEENDYESVIELDSEMEADDGEQWVFAKSIAVSPATSSEVGKIESNVSLRALEGSIRTCLIIADRVANEAIMSNLEEFHVNCKRRLKAMDSTIRITSIEHRVTPEALYSIPELFSNKFISLLTAEIQTMWGDTLPTAFFTGELLTMVQRLLRAANKFFQANGRLFLNLKPEARTMKQHKTKDSSGFMQRFVTCERCDAASDLPTVTKNTTVNAIHENFPLGYVLQTLQAPCKTERCRQNEFFSSLFHCLKNCVPHKRCEKFHCGEWRKEKWGHDLPFCQRHLIEVKENLGRNLDALEKSASSIWKDDNYQMLNKTVRDLKRRTLRKVAEGVGDTLDQDAHVRNVRYKSSIYCYELPASYNRDSSEVSEGGKFVLYHSDGQIEKALWRFDATHLSCEEVTEESSSIHRDGDSALLGDFIVPAANLPRVHELQATIEVKCSLDLWNEKGYGVTGKQYLGLRRYDLVLVIFSFHSGRPPLDQSPHPLSSNYEHSLLGIVADDPVPCEATTSKKALRRSLDDVVSTYQFVGPSSCSVRVVLQDDIMYSSGCSVKLPEVVQRWQENSVKHNNCYFMPLEGFDFNREIHEYVCLAAMAKLPKPFKLSIVSPKLAGAFINEQRHMQHHVKKQLFHHNPLHQSKFKSLGKLETEWRERLHKVLRRVDNRLNKEQLSAIEAVLYGWGTNEVPDEIEGLEVLSEDIKKALRNSDVVPKADLEWWGSNICYLRGSPASGKTTTISALVATVMQFIDGGDIPPRILVVSKNIASTHHLHGRISKLLRSLIGNKEAYQTALGMLVVVGESESKEEVRKRLRREAAIGMVDKARVVLTTWDGISRSILRKSKEAFSFLVVDDVSELQQESCVSAVCAAFVRDTEDSRGAGDFKKVSILLVGDQDMTRVETGKSEKPFFYRIWDEFGDCDNLAVSLSTQYNK